MPPGPGGGTFIIMKKYLMAVKDNWLYILAAVLVIAWIIGYYGTNADGLIHVLLVLAAIAVSLRNLRGKRVVRDH